MKIVTAAGLEKTGVGGDHLSWAQFKPADLNLWTEAHPPPVGGQGDSLTQERGRSFSSRVNTAYMALNMR